MIVVVKQRLNFLDTLEISFAPRNSHFQREKEFLCVHDGRSTVEIDFREMSLVDTPSNVRTKCWTYP